MAVCVTSAGSSAGHAGAGARGQGTGPSAESSTSDQADTPRHARSAAGPDVGPRWRCI